MKCKREKNFAANRKYERKERKRRHYHKEINWFRAFMMVPWWERYTRGNNIIKALLGN